MEHKDFTVSARDLGEYDVLVAGGGVAGTAAAATAARQGAKVLLVEGCGCLGGALTDQPRRAPENVYLCKKTV